MPADPRPWKMQPTLRERAVAQADQVYEEGYRAGLRTADEWPLGALAAIEDDLCRHEISTSPDPVLELCQRFSTGRRTIMAYRERIEDLQVHLNELHKLVWGECPSLLNENSGGNSRLDGDIEEALKRVY